jgi:hypothetical protein
MMVFPHREVSRLRGMVGRGMVGRGMVGRGMVGRGMVGRGMVGRSMVGRSGREQGRRTDRWTDQLG